MTTTEIKPGWCPCSLINCLTSSSLLCYICCQGCRISKVRNGFIFLPPNSSYKLVQCDGVDPQRDIRDSTSLPSSYSIPKYKLLYTIEELATIPAYVEAARSARAYQTKTSRGETIYLIHMPPYTQKAVFIKPEERRRPCIIHCHGNATDMGLMMLAYIDLATTLQADVIGVEYTGFGVSSGVSDHRDIDADIEAAYNFVTKIMQVDPKDIILYGQSVGSAPVLSLAAKYRTHPVAGAILHSAMLSGIQVLDPEIDKMCRPSQVFKCFDIFPNLKHVRDSDCDILLIHGQRDDVIPFVHAKRLFNVGKQEKKSRNITSYFPLNSGHNDISELNRSDYYRSIHNFLHQVLKDRPYKYGSCYSRNSRPAFEVRAAPWQMEMDSSNNSTEGSQEDSMESRNRRRSSRRRGKPRSGEAYGGEKGSVSSREKAEPMSSSTRTEREKRELAARKSISSSRNSKKDAARPSRPKKKSGRDPGQLVISCEDSRTMRRSRDDAQQAASNTSHTDECEEDSSALEVGNPQDVCDESSANSGSCEDVTNPGLQIEVRHDLSNVVGPTDGKYDKIRKGSTWDQY